jgi:hypothetical protein
MAWRLLLMLAALAALPATACAQDLAKARAFVTGLYAAYARSPGPDYLGRQAKDVFSPALLTLIRREAAHTPEGEVGALDGDPFCNCQDYKITAVQVAVAASGSRHARADVGFLNVGQKQRVTLDLVAAAGQWRVDDIHEDGMPSLVALLRDSLTAAPR